MRRVSEEAKSVGAASGRRRGAAHSGAAVAAFADDLPAAVLVADADALVSLCNTRAAALLGRRAEEVLGRPVADVLPLLDEAGRSWWDVVAPWSGLRTRTGHRERLLTIPGRGRVLVAMQYGRPVRNAPVDRVTITLRVPLEEAAVPRPYADVLAVAAHELRSPLASVHGFSATLLRQWDRFTDEQRRAMVATVEADAERLSRMLAQLLDAALVGTPRLTLNPTVFDLRRAVDAHLYRLAGVGVDLSRFAWAESGAQRAPAWVRADRDRVDQIIANLVDNALKHGAGTITVATDTDDPGFVGLAVSDEGPGIDAAHERAVFIKFWRGDRPDSTGLGLYLVKGLVEAHGGTVTVGPAGASGHDGRPGARFRITLPAAG